MGYAPMVPRTVEAGEIVSLTERLARLQLLRVAFVFFSVAGASLGFHATYAVQRQLWAVGGAYLVIICAAELIRHQSRRSSLATLAALLLVDGVYLAWVTYATGGTQSPLRFLLYIHFMAVVLLASRTGLKIAL